MFTWLYQARWCQHGGCIPVVSLAKHCPRETSWGQMNEGQTKQHRIDMLSQLPTPGPLKCRRSIQIIRGTTELTYQSHHALVNGRHWVRDMGDGIGRRGATHGCTKCINEGFQTVKEGSRFEGSGDSKGEGMKGRLETGRDEGKGDAGRSLSMRFR